jgi:hypothetical protein
MSLAWGNKVSSVFRARVTAIAGKIGCQPSDLMGCMAWESGRTFSASIRNGAGSGAVGLIQFMPQTASALGTTTAALAAMTPEQQLDFVDYYFRPWRGHLHNLSDLYMAILWPAGIGKSDDAVLFDKADTAHPKLYLQNRGLDVNANGQITRGECCAKVKDMLALGMAPGNVWEDA